MSNTVYSFLLRVVCLKNPILFFFFKYVREFITLHDTQKLCLDWNIPENPGNGPV